MVLVAGQRELAWLRLVNTDADSREITRFDSAKAEEVLFRPTPFHDWEGISEMPGWVAHNESLKLMPESPTSNVLAVLMLLKLISMAQLTMHAPGIVITFARRLQKQQVGDTVSYISLEDFLASFGGHMDEGLSRLVTGNELTPEGLGLMPAAKQVVDAILHHAETVVGTYLRKSELVHCVHNGAGTDADGKLWLTATGTDDGKLVGKLPHAVHRSTLHTEFRKAGKDRKTWCKEYNHQFRRFVTGFTTGVVDANLYQTYISLSFMNYDHALPAGSLQTRSTETAQAVTAGSSAPFGTIQRRVLVDPKKSDTATGRSDLVMVLEKWSNINTDAYTPSTFWSVVSWCGSTQADLDTAPLLLDRSEKMSAHLYNVSVTLASLLSIRVGDDGSTIKDYGVNKLNGMLGPVVQLSNHTPGHAKQVMRLVSFTHEDLESAFVLLLPEVYVQYAVDYYNYDYRRNASASSPMIATEGFVALPDEAAVPLYLPNLSEAEISMLRSDLGTRVWALPKKRSEKTIATFTAADYSAIEAMRVSSGPLKETVIPGYTIMHTRQTDRDSIAGIQIGLTHVPGFARMTIDTDLTSLHAIYRVVAQK